MNKNSDVKIITCHNVYNYGAALQAFALQETIEMSGVSCQIIDYNPWYLYDRYQFWNIGNKKWERNIFTKLIYYIGKFPSKIIFKQRKKCFEKFNDEYFHLTQQKYFNGKDLEKCSCQILICGSDQIWNTVFENGNDGAFFGEYVQKKYLFSYAASIGADSIPDDKKEWFRNKLKYFDAISVRESNAKVELEKIDISPIHWTVDPVYLLNKQQWIDKFNLKQETQEYLLIYIFESDVETEKIVKFVAKKQNLKIYSVNSTKCNYADKSFHLIGPEQFMELVLNASLIVTNSFHGVSFSVIFRKQFWVLQRKMLNTRISDMLDSVKIRGRALTVENICEIDFNSKINYDDVDFELQHRIEKSKEFLNKCLGNTDYEE